MGILPPKPVETGILDLGETGGAPKPEEIDANGALIIDIERDLDVPDLGTSVLPLVYGGES